MKTKPAVRFAQIGNAIPGFDDSEEYLWWWDMERPSSATTPASIPNQPFVAIQVDAQKNPNDYKPIGSAMYLLYTDQAEYYVVCEDCYYGHRHMQWSGHTRAENWKERSDSYLDEHQKEKGWCEFCDPVFGNGGWVE